MNILFIGSHLLAQRVVAALKREDIKVTYLSEPPSAIDQIKQNKFDLVIVDSLLEKAKETSSEIYDLANVPVILMVDQSKTNWKTISEIDADGFVTEDASNIELLARTMALTRRYTIKTKKSGNVQNRKLER